MPSRNSFVRLWKLAEMNPFSVNITSCCTFTYVYLKYWKILLVDYYKTQRKNFLFFLKAAFYIDIKKKCMLCVIAINWQLNQWKCRRFDEDLVWWFRRLMKNRDWDFTSKLQTIYKFSSRVALEGKMHRLSYARNDSGRGILAGKFLHTSPPEPNMGRSPPELPLFISCWNISQSSEILESPRAARVISPVACVFPSYFPTYFIFPDAYTTPSSP